MSLVTRFSAFFLLALALALGGFSACLYALIGMRLYQDLDRELIETLDRLQPGRDPGEVRMAWALFDERGRRLEGAPPSGSDPIGGSDAVEGERLGTALIGRDPATLPDDTPLSITGRDGRRWRVLARRISDDRRRRRSSRTHHEPGGVPDLSPTPPRPRGWRGPPPPPRERGQWTLAAWAPLAPLEAELHALALVLMLISIGLWGLSAALGRYFGRRALAPLARMAEAARAMPWDDGEDRGARRLPSPGTRDELEDFARSFNGLLDRLHEALERQAQFTAEASHQLRTPLAGVIAAIEVARRRRRTVEEHERVLDRVHGDAVRLWRVVEALLFLARADAEASLPGLERLDLAAWLASHLQGWSAHERAADLHGPEMEAEGPLWVRANPALLGQLLDNLLENACKYSPAGRPIAIRAWAEPGVVALSVADHGCGVPPEDLPHLFEPFYRSAEARRQGHAGFGLGLAVVRRIASALGGTVAVESTPGQGTRFVLGLPAADLADHNPAPPPASAEAMPTSSA